MTSSEPGGMAVPDTPQTADTDAPPPSSGAPVTKRAHRFLVPVLLVLATIIGIPAAFAVWVNRQALNTSNWSSTSGKVLEDKRVQTALSAYLVHELFTNVNVSADLQKRLPKQLQPLAGPAAARLQQRAGQLAPKLLASPQAQALWVQANVAAHKELLKVLNGGGPVVSTGSGVVTLNLHTLVSQLAATLGVSSQVAAAQSKLQGSTGASARATAQQKLGITLPPANGQLVILRSNQLGTAQDIANAVKHLAIVLPAIALLLFALAVYLARGRRRRTLRTAGWCFVLIGVVLLLIRRIGGDAVVNGLVKVPSNKPAVHDVWNIGTSLLYSIAVAMIAYGIVIVATAWLAGSTRPATAIRKFIAPSLRESPAVAYSAVGAVLLLVVLWGPTPAFRNLWWILVFAALLALGVTMLRRETAREFPEIEHGQALHDFQARRAQSRAGEAASAPAPGIPATVGAAAANAPSTASSMGRVETLERLAALRDSGAITNDEYQAEKAHVMRNGT
ncbi:MAG: SHOCT domain-containing protein [Solirubrobacteraceae bacterium]